MHFVGEGVKWGILFGLSTLSKSAPKIVKLKGRTSPVDLFTKLYENYNHVYILESVEGPEKLAEYSFIGFDPSLVVAIKDGKAEVYNRVGDEKTVSKVDDPLPLMKELIGNPQIPSRSYRFIGGAVGYISYDAVRYWEKLPEIAFDDLKLPDFEMGIFDDGIIFDHKSGETLYYYFGDFWDGKVDGQIERHDGFYVVPLGYLRKSKFAYYAFFTEYAMQLLRSVEKMTYESAKGNVCKRLGKDITAYKYLRKFAFDVMADEGLNIPESVADFIQGRTPKSIGARHYVKLKRKAAQSYPRYAEYIAELRRKAGILTA